MFKVRIRTGICFGSRASILRRLCCMCGAAILPNSSNMCVNCLRSRVDITDGLQKQATILWCKQCGRYLQPPKHWLRAEPESKELLTFCLKKIKGLQKVCHTNQHSSTVAITWIGKRVLPQLLCSVGQVGGRGLLVDRASFKAP